MTSLRLQQPARSRSQRARTLLWIGRRLLLAIPLLIGVAVATFALIRLVPGGPIASNLSEDAQADPEIVAAFKAKWGLDKPVIVQLGYYLLRLVQGDLGTSMTTGRPVATDLARRIPATMEIVLPTFTVAILVGTVIGILSALRQNRASDHAVRGAAMLGLSAPPFWIGILAIYLFFYVFDLLPVGGRLSASTPPPDQVTGLYTVDALIAGDWSAFTDALQHIVLPSAVLSIVATATLVRFVRAAVLEVLQKEYLLMAQAKGVSQWTLISRHLLRPALLSVVTIGGLLFASLLSGTVLVEAVFNWPGLGQYAYQTSLELDSSGIIGVTLFVAVVYILTNLLVDLLYGVIDPRIRVME